ncbi:hypothetical protein ACFFWC_31120 [Plantactinospora siamensis]|uniref:Recombination endonuclease VII n=1 Tax=Plantactinospora siamensis TaxID=555372 RepID=A0ABV6NYV4_9ACTN
MTRTDGDEPALRLRVELVPRPLWGRNLRAVLPRSDWQRLRRWALDRAGERCEPCGLTVAGGRYLICHERWTYDHATRTQTLIGVEIHCGDCDLVTHVGRAGVVGGPLLVGQALRRLAELNGWTPAEALFHYRAARTEWQERSQHPWQQDLTWYDRWVAAHPPRRLS